MSRCLVLAATLWDSYRTPANVVHHADGSFTESQRITAGQIERARRAVMANPRLAALLKAGHSPGHNPPGAGS